MDASEEAAEIDYVDVCVEEIALEGLEGITVSALWIRLTHRPNFHLNLDDAAKNFLWEMIVLHPDLGFYVLETPRSPLVIFNRFTNIDLETGLIVEPDKSVEDIYPYFFIRDGEIMGSCATYYNRRKVTDEMRSSVENDVWFLTLHDAMERWGDTLVIVASQEKRQLALWGTESLPNLSLTPLQYAQLERIGRSRYLGDVTVGHNSLSVISPCSKTLFYNRTVLLKKGLITKQIYYHYHKKGELFQLRSGVLLHLTRFYVERKSRLYLLYQELVKHLSTKPDRTDSVANVLSLLGIKHQILKKAFQKSLKKLAEICQESVKKWNPDQSTSNSKTANKTEKTVRVIRLFDHVNLADLPKLLYEDASGPGKKDIGNEDDEEEEVDIEEDVVESCSGKNAKTAAVSEMLGIANQKNYLIDRPLLHQAYDVFMRAGSEGLSEKQFSRAFGVPRLDGRAICRKLLRLNVLSLIMKEFGRQKCKMYVAISCSAASHDHQELVGECEKILAFATDAKTVQETATEGTDEMASTTDEVKKEEDTFLSDVRLMCESRNGANLTNSLIVTSRSLKRANMILKAVKEQKLIEAPFILQKLIKKEEENENHRIDHKSLMRLIVRLSNAGLIKSVKTVIRHEDQERNIHLICDPSLKATDPLIFSAIEHAKLKYFSVFQIQQLRKDMSSIEISTDQLRNLYKSSQKSRIDFEPQSGKIYGYEPKFLRMKLLHEYLFYLVNEYTGQPIEPLDSNYPREVSELLSGSGVTVPVLYHSEVSWRMFLPPLPHHTGWTSGWCLYSDILIRMPIGMLTKLVNINYKVNGLSEYLDHPIKKHFPITHLPSNLRSAVLFARKYVFSIFETASYLGYMGIMSFNRSRKEKDEAFLYLHRNARIVDTTISRPGYTKISKDKNYPVQEWTFNRSSDVSLYWVNLETICRNTPLGLYSKVNDEVTPIEVLSRKSLMLEVMVSKSFDGIVDEGQIPGDGLGAGGLDSDFFSHLKRNWNWANLSQEKKSPKSVKATNKHVDGNTTNQRQGSLLVTFMKKEGSMQPPSARKRLTRLAINRKLQLMPPANDLLKTPSVPPSTHNKKTASKKRKFRSGGKHRNIRKRRPYYDERDKIALKLLTKARVSWSVKEDSMLLLTKVASLLLDRKHRKMSTVVPYSAVRDFLHRHIEHSKNKTSRACQRRLAYMMLNPETYFNVCVFVGEAQDDEIIREVRDRPYTPLTNEEEWIKRYEVVMARLLVKFLSSASLPKRQDFQIPDSLEKLLLHYDVTLSSQFMKEKRQYVEVQNTVDIHYNVAHSLILSAVGSICNKEYWDYLLYNVFQQFPDSLLQSVLAKLRASQVVSRLNGKRSTKKALYISSPYQLSITYQNLFLSCYRKNVYKDAYEMLKLLVMDKECDGSGVQYPLDDTGGCSAAVTSLFVCRLVNFNMVVPENIVYIKMDEAITSSCQNVLKNFCQWEEETDDMIVPVNNNSVMDTGVSVEGLSIEPPKKKPRLEQVQPSTSGGVDCATSIPEDAVEVQAVSDKMSKITQSSRFAMYLLRSQMSNQLFSNLQHAHDYLAVNPCSVSCRLTQFNKDLLDESALSTLKRKYFRFIPSNGASVEQVALVYKSLGYSCEAVCEMELLHNFLLRKRELGAKCDELKEVFWPVLKELDLRAHLELMAENLLILKVGVVAVRYVSVFYSRPWVLHTFRLVDKVVDLQPVQCLCRPWLKPNGDLNREVFNEMLQSMLSFIMCHPGTSFDALSNKYASVLSPVQISELLQILEDSKCIRSSFVRQSHKTSLFTPVAEFVLVDNQDEATFACYHAEPDCILRLGNLCYGEEEKDVNL